MVWREIRVGYLGIGEKVQITRGKVCNTHVSMFIYTGKNFLSLKMDSF